MRRALDRGLFACLEGHGRPTGRAAVRQRLTAARVDPVLFAQHVPELRMGIRDRDRATLLDLATQVEEQTCDVRTAVQLGLDARERAAALPERALLAGTSLGMSLGDQLERAEGLVLLVAVHAPTLAGRPLCGIGPDPDRACGLSTAWGQ